MNKDIFCRENWRRISLQMKTIGESMISNLKFNFIKNCRSIIYIYIFYIINFIDSFIHRRLTSFDLKRFKKSTKLYLSSFFHVVFKWKCFVFMNIRESRISYIVLEEIRSYITNYIARIIELICFELNVSYMYSCTGTHPKISKRSGYTFDIPGDIRETA